MTSPWFRNYEILRQLRAGGMATLVLARRHGDAGFSRLVALRLIRPNLVMQAGFLHRFDDAGTCSPSGDPKDGPAIVQRSGNGIFRADFLEK